MITGVVLARNEEGNIVQCLEALRPHVAEIFLIDMESSDRTVELARPYVRKVLPHKRVQHFDSARNIAIAEAAHDWLWFVDADEWISEKTGRVVNDLLRSRGNDFDAITIPFKSYLCGQWMQHCGWWPGYTGPRVLRRGHFRYSERVHGGVELRGREMILPADPTIGVDHYSYHSLHHYLEKSNRYTDQEAVYLAEEGNAWDWEESVRAFVRELWRVYDRKKGGEDGALGWMLSWLSAQYQWLSRTKIYQRDPALPADVAADVDRVPDNVSTVFRVMEDELAARLATCPQLPLGIVLRAPIWSYNGYADESRTLAKALAGGERPLRIDPIHWNDPKCRAAEGDQELFRALTLVKRPQYVATITNCIPSISQPDPTAAFNALRTTFETDRIPPEWLEDIGKFHEVWVISEHNRKAFQRSGVPPEFIRVVPSCVDTRLFCPEGPWRPLPESLRGRFVFLSIFDWQLRKGWDVLLRAYCQEFRPDEGVGLLLKVTRGHDQPKDMVQHQVDCLLAEYRQSMAGRGDIALLEESLQPAELAALYRSADAFVLASRGEGWGRPYMEAMATGLPTIGTRGSGNLDFMTDDNSQLIDAELVDVSEAAGREMWCYRGHRWFEPNQTHLRQLMRRVATDATERLRISERGLADIRRGFDLSAGRAAFEAALVAAEERVCPPELPEASADQLGVVLEGEFFAGHSFANINEQIALQLRDHPRIALSLSRRTTPRTNEARYIYANRLLPLIDRRLPEPARVEIRHCFPPNWQRPRDGAWVHIQPWEFGYLPEIWLEQLRDQVDEIWAPSEYVKRVYTRSGVPAAKIHVIPWGVDPQIFQPQALPLLLPSAKRFRFLYVGGAIVRKGFDRLLDAYLAEFRASDDVCLIVKDSGANTWYKLDTLKEQILAAQRDPDAPEILYYDGDFTAGQLAGLYTTSHCFVAPYRGEGFGLPVLEAQACGLPVIVPQGGPTEDFVLPEAAWLLPSAEIPTRHVWKLCGEGTELAVDLGDLRRAMREAYADPSQAKARGERGSRHVLGKFTWEQSVARMVKRIEALAQGSRDRARLSRGTNGAHHGLQERWLEPHVPLQGRVFIDIGANRGDWSRFLSAGYEQVHAIEPHPDALLELRKELPDNVMVHETAAWNGSARPRFTKFQLSMHTSAYFQGEGINTGPPVGELDLPCATVDSLPIEGPVDFIKYDTEGAEVECLEGAAELVARDRPALLIEVHSTQNFKRLSRLLADWDYVFNVIRNPYYEPRSKFWYEHCWLACHPVPNGDSP